MKNLLRNLFYASGIIAALSFTIHQWATPALGAFASSLSGVAFVDCFNGGVAVLRDDGRVFVVSTGGSWAEMPVMSPTVPPSQIVSWNLWSFLDTAGNAWTNTGTGWTNAGPVPGGAPTAVTPQTWSQIKGQYAPKTGGGN